MRSGNSVWSTHEENSCASHDAEVGLTAPGQRQRGLKHKVSERNKLRTGSGGRRRMVRVQGLEAAVEKFIQVKKKTTPAESEWLSVQVKKLQTLIEVI